MVNPKFLFQKIICLFLLLLLLTCAEKPHDIVLPWDWDGDGLSDCVETNNANAHHNFNSFQSNQNPSLAHGLPWNGTLGGGINICDAITGYYHFLGTDPVNSDDWGTLALIQVLEAAGREWNKYFQFDFGFGDMSLQTGGNFPPHISHQNGLDVDMRYIRTDGSQQPLNIATQPSLYDVDATVDLMNILIYAGEGTVTDIFVDTNYAQIMNASGNILKHADGHTDHFHVRIQDPDGTNN